MPSLNSESLLTSIGNAMGMQFENLPVREQEPVPAAKAYEPVRLGADRTLAFTRWDRSPIGWIRCRLGDLDGPPVWYPPDQIERENKKENDDGEPE